MPVIINGTTGLSGVSTVNLANGSVTQNILANGVAGTGPAFSAWASTGTTAASSTFTKVMFASEEFDTANCFDSTTNYRFTPNVAGYYYISGCVGCGVAVQITSIYKNGAEFKRGNQLGTGAYLFSTIAAAIIYFNGTTDYVELYWHQNTGTNQITSTGQALTYFQGFLVRAA